MKYHFDATEDYLRRQSEIEILIDTAKTAEEAEKQKLFLKLAVVSLVTKFQVYIESILKEFVYIIQSSNIQYDVLPLYMQLNSIKINVTNNALFGLTKHDRFTEETRTRISEYIESISYITGTKKKVDNSLNFKTSFPLGKTGKQELLDLFKQIEGNENIFLNEDIPEEEIIDLEKLNALLLTRHLIIHQDRFNETDVTIKEYIKYVVRLVEYCDSYLAGCLDKCGVILEKKEFKG